VATAGYWIFTPMSAIADAPTPLMIGLINRIGYHAVRINIAAVADCKTAASADNRRIDFRKIRDA
jgi:hypothetical protein